MNQQIVTKDPNNRNTHTKNNMDKRMATIHTGK